MSQGKYKAYPEYKDSGMEHLGSCPIDWYVIQVKFFAELNCSKSEVNHLPLDTDVTFLPMEAIGEKGELDTSQTKKIQEVKNGYTYLREGDVCVAKITPCFENGKAAIMRCLTNGVAFATTEVVPLRCKKNAFVEYIYYLLTCAPFNLIAEGAMYGAGGQKRVSDNFIANYTAALPSLPEQIQIAKFLDHETAKIDRLIEKQEELIRLLKEKRQAVISHAVTRGLNPDVPLKDSGIEWLGQVPEHWVVGSLKYCIGKIEQGWSPQCDNRPAGLEEWGVLKVGCVNEVSFNEREQKCLPANLKPDIRYEIKEADILVSRGNSLELVGLASVVRGVRSKLLLSDLIYRFRALPEKANPEYLVYSLRSNLLRSMIESKAVGSSPSMKKIGQDTLQNLLMLMPPLNEQLDIVDYIQGFESKINELISKASIFVTLLQERRTALISAAVTGKIDVREWNFSETETA